MNPPRIGRLRSAGKAVEIPIRLALQPLNFYDVVNARLDVEAETFF